MPALQRRFDIQIGGKGFMLSRQQNGAHSWQRTGRGDTPGQRSSESSKYGTLPDELDHPEVWNDWSDGFGYPVRQPGANTYHWAQNFDARWPNQLVHCQETVIILSGTQGVNFDFGMDGPPSTDAERLRVGFGSLTFFGRNHIVLADPNTNQVGLQAAVTNDNVSFYGRAALFGSFYYIGVREGTQFARYTIPQRSLAQASYRMEARAFAIAGNRLWRAFGSEGSADMPISQIRSVAANTDPTLTANWSASLTIGNGQYDIKDMIGFEDQLFIGMADGLYAGDQSGTFYNVMNELATQRHPDNCRDLTVFQGAVVAQHIGGIFSYRASDFEARVDEISPPRTSTVSPVTGYPRCLTPIGPWLLAGYWNGTDSYILAGRPGPQRWIWHSLNQLTGVAGINRMFVDGITTTSGGVIQVPNRLWILTDASLATTGSAIIYGQSIPFQHGNPLASQPGFVAWYKGSARIDLGSVDWGSPGTLKVFRDVEIWANNMASSVQWCQIYYDVDHSGSFALLGTSAKSPKDTLYFPTGEGSFVTGQSIELSLRSFTASQGVTPVYRSIILRGTLLPRSVDMIEAMVRIADDVRDRSGQIMRAGATMIKELRDLANPDANVGPHQLIDLSGATSWVKIMPPIEEEEVYQMGEEYPEIAARVKMAVLSYS